MVTRGAVESSVDCLSLQSLTSSGLRQHRSEHDAWPQEAETLQAVEDPCSP